MPFQEDARTFNPFTPDFFAFDICFGNGCDKKFLLD